MKLPLPVRIAAGLAATAVEQVRELPRLVLEFPVTAVSQALQVSMRVQQQVTELAIKGDRVLGALRPVAEKPSWATFDDEPRRNGSSTVTELRRHPISDAPSPIEPENIAPLGGTDAAGPNVLPEYHRLTIPQLRGKLRHLDVDDLRTLLDWEQAHLDRPPFVTMLTNRITTVNES